MSEYSGSSWFKKLNEPKNSTQKAVDTPELDKAVGNTGSKKSNIWGDFVSATKEAAKDGAISPVYYAPTQSDYNRLDRLSNKEYKDTFVGQFGANRTAGRLSQDASLAWNTYLQNPNENTRKYAEAASKAAEQFQLKNTEALDDVNVKASFLTKDLAGYLPQFGRQTAAQIGGGLLGAAAGPAGIKAGAVLASGAASADVMRGAAFKTLVDLGIDEETAIRAASDEAFISGLSESADTLVDLATLGTGKLISLLGKGAAKTAGKEATKSVLKKVLGGLGKYGLNIGEEALGEGFQSAVSLANIDRMEAGEADSGKLDLAKRALSLYWDRFKGEASEEDTAEIKASEAAGARLAALLGGVTMAGTAVANRGVQQSNPLADTILAMEAERAQQANPLADTLMGEEQSQQTQPLNRSQANKILDDPAKKADFEKEYGVKLTGSKSEQAKTVMELAQKKAEAVAAEQQSNPVADALLGEEQQTPQQPTEPAPNIAEDVQDTVVDWMDDERNDPQPSYRGESGGYAYNAVRNGDGFDVTVLKDGQVVAHQSVADLREVPGVVSAAASQQNTTTTNQQQTEEQPTGPFHPINEQAQQGQDMPGGVQGEPPPVNSDFDRSTEGQPGGTERTSQTPYTVRNARVTSEEMRDIIDRKGAEGEYNYWAITNDETVQRASEAIAREGWDSAYAAWVNDVKNGKAGDQVTATGAILYNHALSAGNKALADDILLTYQDALRNTARGLQAGKIIQQLSPDSRLYMIQRSIDRYAADMGLQDDIVLSDELKQAYRDAKTEADRNAVIEQMQKEVAAQLPASPMEKWVALRYVNMLGNFKTQIRNVGGNVTSRGLSGIKNAVRTSIESLVYSKESGKRTSSYFVGKEYMDAGRSDFRDTMKDAVLGGGKYSDTSPQGFMRGVQEQKRIFANPLLEGYRKATNWAMETGDQIFSEEAYARAIAGWMKAKGISADQFRAMLEAEKAGDISAQDSKRLSDARMFAKQEAQEITFRDDNAFSNWISKIGRRKDTPKAARILAEGALPFRKTPANVLVRAVEYSPVGMVEAAYKLVQSRKPGSDITGADVINNLSKSLTGTGLFLLGAALKNAGWLTGGEDDRKQDAFNDLRGEQAWALFLPDGTNFTLDWASSIAFPLFMGAEFAAAVGDDGVQWADLDDAMLSIVDPLLEFSMMQGISDTLDSVKYSENNLIQLAAQTAVGYLSQGLTNSLFGQAERSTESGRRETYIDRDSGVPVWVQQSIGKTSAKTPGWDHNQVDYVDAWGRTQDYGKGNLFNQFLNPSYVSTDRSTSVDDELQRLYDAGQTAVFPQRFAQSDQVTTYDADGESTGKRYLTAEEYEQFNRTMGETRLEMAEKLIQSSAYKAMGNEAKAKAISLVYEYGKAVATKEVEASYKLDGWMQKAMDSDNPARYIQMYAATKALTPPEGSDSVKKYQELGVMAKQSRNDDEADGWIKGQFTELQGKKYDLAREYGFSPERFVEFYEAQSVCDNNKQKVIDYLTNKKGWPADQANNIAKLCSLWGSKEETVNNWRW